jgi:hypothetical protein
MDSINANKDVIVIDNSKICSFYNNNRNIDIVTTNLFFIDFFENLTGNANNTSANINIQLLSFMNENKKQIEKLNSNIESVSDSVAKLNTDMANHLLIQLANNKKDYIEDIKSVVLNSSLTVNEKINSMIHQNNEHLIDKTRLILNEIIPKNNEALNSQVQTTFKLLNEQIAEDTRKIITSTNSEKMLSEFISNFENKYNATIQTIQQPLFSFFTASEDRINKNINVLKENSTDSLSSQTKLHEELTEFLGKYKGSSNKGKCGEQRLSTVLNETYCDAEIINTSGTKASGDFTMKRFDKPTIMFENKEYDFNVPKDEVQKFIRDIENLNTSGVLISQHTGIVYKRNFQIDINKSNVLVYIHSCEYSADKIKTAVDIIDYLYKQIRDIGADDDANVISAEILDSINDDFQKFLNQKESLLMIVKDFNKKISSQIEDIQFPTLEKYLSNKYASVKSQCLLCDMCNQFSARNKQSLAAHKRACTKNTRAPSTVQITTLF